MALVFLRERIDTSTPVGRLVRTVLAAIAEFERDLIAERTRTGLEARAERRQADGRPAGDRLPGRGRGQGHRTGGGRGPAPDVIDIFERIADGQTPGTVGRWLNAQGIRSLRGAPFNQRTVRKVIANDAYTGQKGYPRIVSDELALRARDQIVRLDPAEVQRRKGGRRPREPYMLRSIAFCACGSPLYRSYAYGNDRTYVCRQRLEATGACNRRPIPAELLEAHVLNHLSTFVGSVEDWISGVLAECDGEAQEHRRAIDAERAKLAALERLREERMAELTEVGITAIGLEVIERIDADIDSLRSAIEDAGQALQDVEATPDVDAALDFYTGLVDVIAVRVRRAPGVRGAERCTRQRPLGTVVRAGLGRSAGCEIRPAGAGRPLSTYREPAIWTRGRAGSRRYGLPPLRTCSRPREPGPRRRSTATEPGCSCRGSRPRHAALLRGPGRRGGGARSHAHDRGGRQHALHLAPAPAADRPRGPAWLPERHALLVYGQLAPTRVRLRLWFEDRRLRKLARERGAP